MSWDFEGDLWRYPGPSGWHFVTLPQELAEELRERTAGNRTGFGSIKVTASAAGARWETSVFPDAESGSFLLPVKAAVRNAAGWHEGERMAVSLELRGQE